MPRVLSLAARSALYAQETGEAFLELVTIEHPSFTPTLRFVNNTVPITSRGAVYEAWPFGLSLADERDDQVPTVQIQIDNIDRRILEGIRALTTPPQVTVEIVMASSADIVEAGPFLFTLRNTEYDALVITGTLAYEDVLNEPAMQYQFTPVWFPGLGTSALGTEAPIHIGLPTPPPPPPIPPPLPPPSAFYTDTWGRPDSLDLGPNWDAQAGHSAKIVSNQVQATNLSEREAELVSPQVLVAGAQQTAMITLGTFTGAGYGLAGVILRASADFANGYIGIAEKNQAGSIDARIQRVVDGVTTDLATSTTTTWSAGDTLTLSALGTNLVLLRNGVVLLTASDTFLSDGQCGLLIQENTTLSQTTISYFEAGVFRGGPTAIAATGGSYAITGTTLRERLRKPYTAGVYTLTGTAATLVKAP